MSAERGEDVPTADELRRVAAYWNRVEALTCQHPEIVFSGEDPPYCSKCDRPVQTMSDIQIDELLSELRRNAPRPS